MRASRTDLAHLAIRASEISIVSIRVNTDAAAIAPLVDVEKRAILHAIALLNGDKLEAAKQLGIGKTTLYRKLKEYGAAV